MIYIFLILVLDIYCSLFNDAQYTLQPREDLKEIDFNLTINIMFYADWCHFSQNFAPKWEEIAK